MLRGRVDRPGGLGLASVTREGCVARRVGDVLSRKGVAGFLHCPDPLGFCVRWRLRVFRRWYRGMEVREEYNRYKGVGGDSSEWTAAYVRLCESDIALLMNSLHKGRPSKRDVGNFFVWEVDEVVMILGGCHLDTTGVIHSKEWPLYDFELVRGSKSQNSIPPAAAFERVQSGERWFVLQGERASDSTWMSGWQHSLADEYEGKERLDSSSQPFSETAGAEANEGDSQLEPAMGLSLSESRRRRECSSVYRRDECCVGYLKSLKYRVSKRRIKYSTGQARYNTTMSIDELRDITDHDDSQKECGRLY
ncbi:hypothetical protein Tco_0150135 [Tanacetum coccineum]